MKFFSVVVLCLASFFPQGVRPVFGETSVSLDDAEGKRRVWMNRRLVRVRVEGVIAHTVETLAFQGGWEAREYIYTFPLPEGSVVTGLELVYPAKKGKKGKPLAGRSLRGTFFDARFVRKTVESTRGLPRTPDPAWLEWVDRDRYRLRMIPEKPAGPIEVRLHYIHKLSHRMGRRVYRYPRLGGDRRLTDGLLILNERLRPYGGDYSVTKRTLYAGKPMTLPLRRIPGKSGPLSVDLWVAPVWDGKAESGRGGGETRDPDTRVKPRSFITGLVSVAGNPQEGVKRPTSLVFAVDVSRSMWKQSRVHSVRLLNALAGRLGAHSRFQLVTFSREPEVFFERPAVFGRANLKKAARRLLKAPPENGTDIVSALKKSFELVGEGSDGTRRLVVLLTDGLIPGDDLSTALAGTGEGVELVVLMGTRASEPVWDLDGGVLADLTEERGAAAYGIDPFRLDRAGKALSGRKGKGGHSLEVGAKNLTSGSSVPDWNELAAMVVSPGRVSNFEVFIDGKRLNPDRRLRQFSTGSSFYRMFRVDSKSIRKAHVQYVYRGARRRENINVVRLGNGEGISALQSFMAATEVENIERNMAEKSMSRNASRRPGTRHYGEPGASPEAQRILDATFRNAREAALRGGIVSWASSLIVLDDRDAFAMDRYRFARRWGHRFFRRLAHEDSPGFPVREPWRETGEDKIPVEIVSTGRLTKGLVQRVVRGSYLKYAKACYEERIGLGATMKNLPQGRVLLSMDLTRGEVALARLKNSELNDLKLEKCLKDGAYKLEIPRSREDRTLYRIIYPLRFRPDDQAVEILEKAGYIPEVKAADDPLHGLE